MPNADVPMKTKLTSLFASLLFLFVAATRCHGADGKPNYPATAAADLLEAACRQAAKDSKLVFVKSGFPECGWCRVFDRYHGTPEVQKIIGKYYVVAVIDTENMADGKAVFGKFAAPGAPSWAIITPQRKKIVDSYAPAPLGNVGYPGNPEETAYYLAALRKATPAIADQELDLLSKQLRKATGK